MAKKSEERLANMAQNNPGEGPDIGEVTKVVRKTKEKQIEVVNCDRLNIRVAPSATAKVSTVVKVGTKGILLEKTSNAWWRILIPEVNEGYAMIQYLEEV